MVDDVIRGKVRIETIRFYNPATDFGILVLSVVQMDEGTPVVDKITRNFIGKGTIPKVWKGCTYYINAIEENDPKYGIQYRIINLYSPIALSKDDYEGKKIYLDAIFTPRQVTNLYDRLDDPYETFLKEDVASLVKVKGIGWKTAGFMLEKFEEHFKKSRVFIALRDYNLTYKMVDKLLKHYHSPDLIIQKTQDNPYLLMEVRGIGWKKCDDIALAQGMDFYDVKRVVAYIKYYLEGKGEDGYSFVYTNSQLMDDMIRELGDALPDEVITEAIHQLSDRLWWSEDHEQIGLRMYAKLEHDIAEKLIKLRDAPNEFHYEGWEQTVQKLEREQGWEHTEQQKEAIKAVLENQVVMISGLAGTGKTTVVKAIIRILGRYEIKQCALAGKASARMSEVTGLEGYTIHRLLGFPKGKDENGGYEFHESNPLEADIVILDEISMVNGWLFRALIDALKPGTKLICLGDIGQLESIGCLNIAHDLICSPEIKSIELNKIHRQAADSAIITDSINIRHGISPIEAGWTGVQTRGVLQDLTYDCYSDANNTFYRIMQRVSTLMEEGKSILDFQVIVPNKERPSGTWNLNSTIQELCNPNDNHQNKELVVGYEKGHTGVLRVGDKVINVRNQYETRTYAGQWNLEPDDDRIKCMGDVIPVFNGNIGIVRDINEARREMIVDFDGIGRLLITSDMLSSIMLGYAITVHKSQGSQAPYIIFGCDYSAFVLLSRELLYTAITRAQKHCYVIAQTKALTYSVAQTAVTTKQTLLPQFLDEVAHPKLIF